VRKPFVLHDRGSTEDDVMVEKLQPSKEDANTFDELKPHKDNSPSQSPGGCATPKSRSALNNFNGVYPTEEFRDMLANRKGMLWFPFNHSKEHTLSRELEVPYCPEPSSQASFVESQEGIEVSYVKEALEGSDSHKPIILAFAEIGLGVHDYKLLQVMNFICGFQRLGLESQVVVFTMKSDSARFLRRLYPWLRVLHHDGLKNMIERAGVHANVPGNRIAKLVLANMLVNMEREVLLSDLDIHWIQDPTQYFQTLKTSSGDLVDLAAMKDCWLELNSGFVYYRPTDRTKQLLGTALRSTKLRMEHPHYPGKDVILLADNDQYLLNCAFARSAIAGLNYVMLQKPLFVFGTINPKCRSSNDRFTVVKSPMVWHTAGFSSKYELEMDRFAALGFIDVNASTGQCIGGRRGSAEHVENASSSLSRLCSTEADGIVTAACGGSCSDGVEPMHGQALLANFQQVPIKEFGTSAS
jgi:hypothetical protein